MAILSAPAGCSKVEEVPEESSFKTIAFNVTVGSGVPETRATVDNDMKTLRFAAGDVLYIASDARADVKGTLTLKEGDEGKDSGATFEGELTYTGEVPADDLELKATLVGSSNVGIGITDGKVTGITYPTDSYCEDVYEAVRQYSYLTGTSTFGTKSFTLSQGTTFLNFSIGLHDGTDSGSAFDVTVANNSSNLATASVQTKEVSGTATARFVLPVAAGTVLSGASVTVSSKGTVSFGGTTDKTLDAKVYNIGRDITASVPLAESKSAEYFGWRIGNDGNVYYPNGALPDGVKAVAVAVIPDKEISYALELATTATLRVQEQGVSPKLDRVPGAGEWCVPRLAHWHAMIAYCNHEQYLQPSDNTVSISMVACTKFLNMYEAAGGRLVGFYWSSDSDPNHTNYGMLISPYTPLGIQYSRALSTTMNACLALLYY